MFGKIFFLCLLATALGGIMPPDKPFNPEDRIYRHQNEDNNIPYPYSTTTEKNGVNNNEERLGFSNRKEADRSKKYNQNGTKLETHNTEPKSNVKESEGNNKKPKRNSNESYSLKNKELKRNGKKPFRRNGFTEESSQEYDAVISKNNQNTASQESKELPSLEIPVSKIDKNLKETQLSNSKSDLPHTDLNYNGKQKSDLNKEQEKPALRDALPVSLGDDGYYKVPKKFFVKWIQPNIERNRMNARQKRLRHKPAFIPDYRDSDKLHYNSNENTSVYYDDDDYKQNNYYDTIYEEPKDQNSKLKLYNDIVEKISASLNYLQEDQDPGAPHEDNKTHVYKKLLGKILELLQYLIVDESNNAHHLDDHKAKMNKEILAQSLGLLYQLLEEQDQNPSTPQDEKAKLNKDIIADIFDLLKVLTERQGQNSRQFESKNPNMSNERLADTFTLLQNMPGRDQYSSHEGENSKLNMSQIYKFIKNVSDYQDEKVPPIEGDKTNNRKELLAKLFAIYNTKNEQDQIELPLKEEISKGNKGLLTQLLALMNAQNDQSLDTTSDEGHETKGNDELISQLLAILNTQNDQGEKVPPFDGDISKDNKILMTQLWAIIKAQNDQSKNKPSGEGDQNNNKLLSQLFPILNTQNDQGDNGGDKSNVNKRLAQVLAIYNNKQNDQGGKALPLEGEISKDDKRLNQILAIFNSKNGQGEKAPLEGEVLKDDKGQKNQLLAIIDSENSQGEKVPTPEGEISKDSNGSTSAIWAIFNAQNETSQKTPSVEGDKTNIDNEFLMKLLAMFLAQIDKSKTIPPIEGDEAKKYNELLTTLYTILHTQTNEGHTEQKQNGNNEILGQIIVMLQGMTKGTSQKPLDGQKANVDQEQLSKLLAMFLNILKGQIQVAPQIPGYIVPPNSGNFNQGWHTGQGQLHLSQEQRDYLSFLLPPNSGNFNQGWHTGQGQSHLSQEQLNYLSFLLSQQNHNIPQIQMGYGNSEIRIKLMQLIKDTKEAIDLKVGPVRKVHEAYKTHRLYRIGYLISSINRTYESVIEFYKYIQQNINTWNILKVLQAYEQVKAADQFLTKAVYILSALTGDVRITQPIYRILQRSHQSALIARERSHTNDLGLTHELALERDLEDTHEVAQDPNKVSQDTHENINETGSQLNQKESLENIYGPATPQMSNLKGKFVRYQGLRNRNNNQNQRNQTILLKQNYERLLKSNKIALKDVFGRSLFNEKKSSDHNSEPLEHNTKRILPRNYERAAIEQAYGNQKRGLKRKSEDLVQRYNKRTLERSNVLKLQRNLKKALRNYEQLLQRNKKDALNDAFELALGNQKGALESSISPKSENHLNRALLREYARLLRRTKKSSLKDKNNLKDSFVRAAKKQKRPLNYVYDRLLHVNRALARSRPNLQRNQKRALKDASERALGNQKRPFFNNNRLELRRHLNRALTHAYKLALINQKRPLDGQEVPRNQRVFSGTEIPNSDNSRRQTSEDSLKQASQKAAEHTAGLGFRPISLELHPNQNMGYNHSHRGIYKPISYHYPTYPHNSSLGPPLCNFNGHLVPCNENDDKLNGLSWSYYDYYYYY